MDEKQRILKLQEDLENGNIIEEDLSEVDVAKIEELYNEQIELLRQMKEMYKKKKDYYGERIRENLDKLNTLKK